MVKSFFWLLLTYLAFSFFFFSQFLFWYNQVVKMSKEAASGSVPTEGGVDTQLTCGACASLITSKSQFQRTNCGHNFHKACLAQCMKTRPFCPTCDARILSDSKVPGAAGISTRSQAKSQPPQPPTSDAAGDQTASGGANTASSNDRSIRYEDLQGVIASAMATQQAQLLASLSDQISGLIRTNVETMFSQLNLNGRSGSPVARPTHTHTTSPREMPTLPSVEERTFREMLGISLNTSGQAPHNTSRSGPPASGAASSRNTSSSDLNSRPDKVLHIMTNWKLKFTGNSNGLPIENFIYRVEALTVQTLQGDFDLLCRNASSLFEGKAADWFWRYHRSVSSVSWHDLCRALRRQYSDSRTDIDIRELIRDRKQNRGENFDSFYESIVELTDRLKEPLSENMLVEILRRNLLPEIQHEILNLKINSLQELRDICRKREFFMQDIRRKHPVPFTKPGFGLKRVSELEEIENSDMGELLDSASDEVSALNFNCWNCHQLGHRYQDCLSDRTVFCYGCGSPNVYKPTCPKCSPKNGRSGAQRSAPTQGRQMETDRK